MANSKSNKTTTIKLENFSRRLVATRTLEDGTVEWKTFSSLEERKAFVREVRASRKVKVEKVAPGPSYKWNFVPLTLPTEEAQAATHRINRALTARVTIATYGQVVMPHTQLPEWGIPAPGGETRDPEEYGVEMWGLLLKQAIGTKGWFRLMTEGVSGFNDDLGAKLELELSKQEKVLIHLENQSAAIKAKVGFPVGGRGAEAAFQKATENLKAEVKTYAEGLIGKTFKYGDIIWDAYGALLNHRKMNQPLMVSGVSIEDAPFQVGGFFVKLSMVLLTDSEWKKIRGFGVKSTLVPLSPFSILVETKVMENLGMATLGEDLFKDVVILHSASGLKGKPLDLVMFCNALPGGAELDLDNGLIIPKEGPYKGVGFDITTTNSVVDQWRNNSAKEVVLSFDYARADWEFVKAVDEAQGLFVGDEGYDILTVEDISASCVRITAKSEVLIGTAPINVEVSLPEENSGFMGLTQELVACLTLQDRATGELVVALGGEKRAAIAGLIPMVLNKAPKDTPVIDLTLEEDLKKLPVIKEGTLDSKVFSIWKEKFPNGVVLKSASENRETGSAYSQYFQFGALAGISTFVGGSGDGLSHQVAQFLRFIPSVLGKAGRTGMAHAAFALMTKGLQGWFIAQLDSKSLRKKLVSGLKGLAFGAKVRTVPLPSLSHEGGINGVPLVGMNPEDDLLMEIARSPFTKEVPWRFLQPVMAEIVMPEEGGNFLDFDLKEVEYKIPQGYEGRKVLGWTIDTKEGVINTQHKPGKGATITQFWVWEPLYMEGEFVSLFRTPMPMQGVCQLRITEEVGVGHMGLLMWVWAMMNEGDSDGDGIALFPIFHYWDKQGLSLEGRKALAVKMNKHPMGMGGYILCYGEKPAGWPCAEFIDYGDACTKKAIIAPEGSKALEVLVKKGILPYVRSKKAGEWCGAAEASNGHYGGNVPKSYNIAVVALYEALELDYKGDDKEALSNALEACAVSWRLIYEGKGLAGSDPASKAWFSLLAMCPFFKGWVLGWDGSPQPAGKNTPQSKIKGFAPAILESLGLSKEKHKEVGRLLVRYANILADQKALENPEKYAKRRKEMTEEQFNKAVLTRALRLLSQGNNEGVMTEFQEAQEVETGMYDVDEEAPTPSTLSVLIHLNSHPELLTPLPKWLSTTTRLAAWFTYHSSKLLSEYKAPQEEGLW